MNCSRSGTTWTSTAFAVGRLDDAEHLDVLFERQRDVEVIDASRCRMISSASVERAEQRQAAVADVIARGAVVEEADDLEAELAVLEDLVGDQPAEVAGAGDQDALQADAGPPAPLERLAHELARRVGESDVEDAGRAPRPSCDTS